MADALNVWMNGQLVGLWSHTRSKTAVFSYELDWLLQDASRALSLSLPITVGIGVHRGEIVENYFENLLPDNAAIRQRIRDRFGVRSNRAIELLTAIGRDCVGAVQLLPPNVQPEGWHQVRSEPMDEAQVAQALRIASADLPLGQRDAPESDFRISIAGAQEKTALLRYGGQWRRPLGSTPTTHILKLPLGLVGNMRMDMHDSVENEWLCSKIMRALNFEIANTEVATFEDQRALVVERFDRRWQNIAPGAQDVAGFEPEAQHWIARLPQEDFCQVTGTPPGRKYETDGGPGIRLCMSQLQASQYADKDLANFVLTQLAFWLLAATDGHAKNFSIFLQRGGAYNMTPLYDVLSAWPVIGRGQKMLAKQDAKMAMAMRGRTPHYHLTEIRVRHWMQLSETSGVEGLWPRMVALVEDVDRALHEVEQAVPNNFPARLWDKIQAGAKAQASQFLRELQRVDKDQS